LLKKEKGMMFGFQDLAAGVAAGLLLEEASGAFAGSDDFR